MLSHGLCVLHMERPRCTLWGRDVGNPLNLCQNPTSIARTWLVSVSQPENGDTELLLVCFEDEMW